MIRIYTSPTCSSSRKVKKWFDEQQIPYVEKNIFVSTLDENELKDMLVKSENGTDDIVSKNSKVVKESKVDIDSMTIKELISFIRENPSALKRPIMVDDTKMQVGYNSEDITAFIPHAKRIAMSSCSHNECPEFVNCENGQEKR